MSARGGPPLIGRRRELADIMRGLQDATSGHGSLVMVVGEPGIGKTRLLEELSALAAERGHAVAWGRCWDGDGSPYYWPWVQILRTCLKDPERDAVARMVESSRWAISQILPELRDQPWPATHSAGPTPEQARFLLFDSVTTFVRSLADSGVLVLILDDLHWSDESSLVLLRLLARSITGWPVLLVGTYRQTERLPAALGELAGDVTRTIHLREMPREDVARLIEVTADATLGPDLVDAIWRETEGNPLFVIEMVRLLVAERPIVKHGQDRKRRLPVPDSIRHVIRRRVDQLGAECGRALEVAAVAGNDFDLIIIEGPLGLPRPRLIEVLEEARAAGMVADQPGNRGAYAFSHPLLRETIYENVPISRRMQLHLRLGEAMEMLLPIDPNPCLGELAYHFCQGAPIGDAGRGIRYSIEAGDRAIEVGAFEEAAELYHRGLDVLNELSPTDIERLAELRSKLDLAIEFIKASRPVQPTAVSRLTPRELEVLGLIARGRSNKEIARHLHLAEKTVKAHVSSVLGKLGVADRTQAAVLAVRQSLDR